MGDAKRKPSARELERIYDEHAGAMFGHGMALLRDEAAVRDILQDVFLKLAEGRVPMESIDNGRGYLLKMVHHAAVDLMRRQRIPAISSSAARTRIARHSGSNWKRPCSSFRRSSATS